MLPTLIRWAHVAGAAFLVGGALLALGACVRGRAGRAGPEDSLPLEAGYRFEWIAWGAIGLVVMTGIGNLGAFGVHLQPPESRWGGLLVAKLLLVLILLPLSLVRTTLLAKLRAAPEAGGAPRSAAVLLSYAATLFLLLAVTLLAVFLAHG